MRSDVALRGGRRVSPARLAVLGGLRECIGQLPRTPGVYLFQDATAGVLYVGKAKCLRSRVASYFQPAADLAGTRGPRILRMIDQHVVDIDFIVCRSEREALARESRLIRELQPPFNVAIKSRRHWAYVQISREPFPRVEVTSSPAVRGTTVIGPFASMRLMREMEPTLRKSFGIRACGAELPPEGPGGKRPCLRFEMGQCTGPCAGLVTVEAYAEQVRRVRRFLGSRLAQQKRQAVRNMQEAVAAQQFEKAAQIRDMLAAAETLCQRPADEGPTPPALLWERLAPLAAELARAMAAADSGMFECISARCDAGAWSVGIAAFVDGRPHKNGYRRMQLPQAATAADAIAQAMARRHAARSAALAGLVLIDGGEAELAVAVERACNPCRQVAATDGTAVLSPGKTPVVLPHRSNLWRYVRRVLREARALAVSY